MQVDGFVCENDDIRSYFIRKHILLIRGFSYTLQNGGTLERVKPK